MLQTGNLGYSIRKHRIYAILFLQEFVMNLIDVMERFPDQEGCITFLESVRWKGKPKCPHCQSQKLTRREHETETGRIGRWNCQDCKATFRVLHSTLFHGTKIPLQKWFLAIALIVNIWTKFVNESVAV